MVKAFKYIQNAVPDVPSWSDLIKALDYKFNNPHPEFVHEPREMFIFNNERCTDIFKYHLMDLQFWNVDNYRSLTSLIPQTKNLINFLKEDVSGEWYIKCLMNLVGKEAALTAHKDDHHVISWQCEGSVEYRIYEDVDSDFGVPIDFHNLKYDSYILNPGDIMIMPAGTIHQAVVFQPRATLILDIPV